MGLGIRSLGLSSIRHFKARNVTLSKLRFLAYVGPNRTFSRYYKSQHVSGSPSKPPYFTPHDQQTCNLMHWFSRKLKKKRIKDDELATTEYRLFRKECADDKTNSVIAVLVKGEIAAEPQDLSQISHRDVRD